MQHTLGALKEFFIWLSRESGFRSRIKVSDTEYLNYGEKEARAARARPIKPFPTLEQVRRAVLAMPSNTGIEHRDRALFALAILTGMRDSALISLRLKHIDADREFVNQDPNMVNTKASKQKSDLFDVLAYIAFALAPITRQDRAATQRSQIFAHYDDKQREFLDFVLSQYVKEGEKELDQAKLPNLLELKYHAVGDATEMLGSIASIRGVFMGFQQYLYGN